MRRLRTSAGRSPSRHINAADLLAHNLRVRPKVVLPECSHNALVHRRRRRGDSFSISGTNEPINGHNCRLSDIFPSRIYLLTLYLRTGCSLSLTMKDAANKLTRGKLAKQSRVNIETIRYYERRGLLPRPPRSASGYRLFSSEDARRVRFIKRAQELGFSLDEIRELLALRVSSKGTQGEVRKLAEAKIADIDEKIKSLHSMKNALERLTSACCGGGRAISDCPILESLGAEEEES